MFASPYTLFFLIATLPYDSLAFPAQIPLQLSTSTLTKPRKLRGRFLQVSDIHPDPYYTPKTSLEKSCHRKKPKKKQPKAGYYGTPFSGCDTPFVLSNFTLDYLGQEWASEIDFVVWTGDNARHDNDHRLPRTPDEIFELNRAVAQKMKDVFLSKGIPVVPSLGNNDVWPHNILSPGPNSVTTEFSNIWESFIPFPYLQVFHRGAYYSVEVVPGEVAVIAMNTMYFYDSNKAVGGCPFHEPDDPGNLQLDWLEVQLKEYRNRNIQVWISGHVPPSPGNYFPDCYVRYVELGLRFQDTILGHLFGHMNADHVRCTFTLASSWPTADPLFGDKFSFLEAIDLEFIEDPDARAQNNVGLFDTLVREFEAIPTKEKDLDLAEYAVVNTSPPVVPNPYMPSFRIFAYNHTGNDGSDGGYEPAGKKRRHGHHRGNPHDKEKQCRKKEHRDTWKCFLNETWHSDPESPSRSNKQWTPLGYAQYYLPNLDQFTKKHKPKFELEYVTFEPGSLHPEGIDPPIPLRHLPKSLRDPGVTESKYAPYEMADLTIPSWIKLAQEMGSGKSKKLRKKFFSYMYMGGDEA